MTESSAVSVEWPPLKPDCVASSLLFCERYNETWFKTTRSSVLDYEWKERDRSVVFYKLSV